METSDCIYITYYSSRKYLGLQETMMEWPSYGGKNNFTVDSEILVLGFVLFLQAERFEGKAFSSHCYCK